MATISRPINDGKNKEADENKKQISQKDEVHFDGAESKIRALPDAIDELIETEHLKGADRAEWEKRKEDMREILRVEVDDRIASERAAAVEEKDKLWYGEIEEHYVLREDFERGVEDRDNKIVELEKTIRAGENISRELRSYEDDLEEREKQLEERRKGLIKLEKEIMEKMDKMVEKTRDGLKSG